MKRIIALCWLWLSVIPTPCVFAQQKQKPSPPQTVPAAMTNQATDKPLTNADIIRLSKAGLADSVIIKVIETSKSKFDLSVGNLIALKNSGVSQPVIEAMQLSASSAAATDKKPIAAPLAVSPLLPVNVPVVSPSSNAAQTQPFAVLIENEEKRIMTAAVPQIVRTKAKGSDLAAIAKDEAVTGALSQIATEAAVRTGVAMGGSAASLPLVGAILGGGMMLGGMLRRKPQITYVMALGGQTASIIHNQKGNAPKIEITYGNIAFRGLLNY